MVDYNQSYISPEMIGKCIFKPQNTVVTGIGGGFPINRDTYVKGGPVSNPEECSNCKLAAKP